ncbi:aldose 1-epimerase family protein [Microvirga sp. 3-52]|nr:aldose 1-epimerase family protein [Microvirga sp. 3-52]
MAEPTILLSSGQLSARVALHGAELVQLQDAEGRNLLWDGNPAFWTGRAPLLFPIVGRVAGDHICVDGTFYPLATHGFARESSFILGEQSPAHCKLCFTSNPATRAQFPFDFELEIDFAIEGPALSTRASVRNSGDRMLPISFGFHPAFRWPLPYGGDRKAHEIIFEHEERAPIRRADNGSLKPGTHQTPTIGDRLLLDDALFEESAVIMDRLNSRSVRYGAPGGPFLQVDFPEMPYLGIWTKPGAGFVCIEPWQGLADTPDYKGEFVDRVGVVHIEPGGQREFVMTISLLPPR